MSNFNITIKREISPICDIETEQIPLLEIKKEEIDSPIRDDEAEEGPLLEIKKEENESVPISDTKIESDEKIDNYYEDQYCFPTDSISGNYFIAQLENSAEIIVNQNNVLERIKDEKKINCKKLIVKLAKLRPCRDCSSGILQNNVADDSKANSEDQHKCPLCACYFITLESLWCHIYVHTRIKPHKCHICRSTFISSKVLVEHLKSNHPNLKTRRCEKCEYVTEGALDFKRHVKTHSDKPYECPYCEYAAVYKYALIRHLRVHTEDRPHQCPQCKYASRFESDLKIHLNFHSEEKPYQCQYCEFVTKYKRSLNLHLIKHSEEKPYRCQYCEFVTKYKRSLNLHLITHSEEKPFRCPHCEFASKHKSCLQGHLRTHTNERPYHCPHCEYAARSGSNLRSHITNVHTERKPMPFPIHKLYR